MGLSGAKEVDLGNGSVGRLLIRLALPAIAAQVVNVLYNLVDRMYIGHLANVGAAALTGVGVTFPLITVISAFAALVSMGGAPRASIMMGADHNDMAEHILGNCTFALIVVATVLTAFISFYGKSVLLMFGASENTVVYAWQYMQIYCLGTIFVQLALGLNAFINAQGFTMTGMLTVLIGAVINIVLDPIFIFVLGMGVRGAALATIISQGISSAWVVLFLTSRRSVLRIRLRYMKAEPKILGPAIALGISPFVMQFTESALNICFNTSLLRYGGDIAVGAMTILNSVMHFAWLPLNGLCQGAQPITSFNYGAGKFDRIRSVFKILLVSCVSLATLLWLISEFATGLPVAIFTRDPELTAAAKWALRIYIFSFPLMGIQTACQHTFISLGNARASTFVALLRKVFLLIPFIYILPMFFEDKVFAVFLAEPIADCMSATTASVLFYLFFRKIASHRVKI